MIPTATSFKSGGRVNYRPFPGRDHVEPGTVRYVSGEFVYVVFDSHRKALAKAAAPFCCRAEDLTRIE